MAYIGNSPGLAKRQLFRYIATSNQAVFSGVDANLLTLNYTPGLEDVFLNGFYIPPANYNATDGSTIIFTTGLSAGDEVAISAAGAYNPADTVSLSANGNDILDKSLFRQAIQTPMSGPLTGYMFNPVFGVSQERGDNSVSVSTNSTTIYVADQYFSQKNGSVVFSSQRTTNNLSAYANYRSFRNGQSATITTAQASFTAGEYISPIRQTMEGTFIKDLAWGTSDAKSIDVAFIVTSSVSGTYALSFRNADGSRSYVTTFALVANTPTLVFKTIPGETSGTWPSDNSSSMLISIGDVTGTTFHAPTLDVWGSGNYISHSTCTNWAATNSAVFIINYLNFFIGGILPYRSTNTTGLLPILSGLRRAEDEELRRCQRYYCEIGAHVRGNAAVAGEHALSPIYFPVEMRSVPTAILKNLGTVTNVSTGTESVITKTGGYVDIISAAAGDYYVIDRKAAYTARM